MCSFQVRVPSALATIIPGIMPLFNRKSAQKTKDDHHGAASVHKHNEHDEQVKQSLVFHCQQAQGSPTGLVSNFSNVRELYQRVADCYDFSSDEVSTTALHPCSPTKHAHRPPTVHDEYLCTSF